MRVALLVLFSAICFSSQAAKYYIKNTNLKYRNDSCLGHNDGNVIMRWCSDASAKWQITDVTLKRSSNDEKKSDERDVIIVNDIGECLTFVSEDKSYFCGLINTEYTLVKMKKCDGSNEQAWKIVKDLKSVNLIPAVSNILKLSEMGGDATLEESKYHTAWRLEEIEEINQVEKN